MNQTIWNYLPKAEPELLELAEQMADRDMKETSSLIKESLEVCRSSVKFALPVNGKIINDGLRGLPDGFRLPYPSISIEYAVDDTDEGINIVPVTNTATKRLVLVRELAITAATDNGNLNLWLDAIRRRAPAECSHVFIVSGFCELAVGGGERKWTPLWCHGMIYNVRKAGSDNFYGTAVPSPCELGLHIAQRIGDEGKDVQEYAHQDIAHEVQAVLELCEALACSNVRADRMPAPLKLNAKRLKAGKPALPDYHVLTISTHHGQDEKATRAAIGDRRAPRQHLRRGHVRIYKSGMRIWINSMVVGCAANGVIGKEYRVTA